MEVACEHNLRRRGGRHHILSYELLDAVRTSILTVNHDLPRQKLHATTFGPELDEFRLLLPGTVAARFL